MKMSNQLRTLAPTAGVVGALLFAAGLTCGVVIGRTATGSVEETPRQWDYTGCVETNRSYELKMGNTVTYTYRFDDRVGHTTTQVEEVLTLTCRFPKLTADAIKER